MGGKGSGGCNKGIKHSEETRKKISVGHIGKKHSEKTKRKMRENHPDLSGKNNPCWKGGKYKTKSGYVYIWKPDHPYAKNHRYIAEHRLVIEKHLKRYLKPSEIVHHIDGDKSNNKLKNLKLFSNMKTHRECHNTLEVVGINLFRKSFIRFVDGKYELNEKEFGEIQK